MLRKLIMLNTFNYLVRFDCLMTLLAAEGDFLLLSMLHLIKCKKDW